MKKSVILLYLRFIILLTILFAVFLPYAVKIRKPSKVQNLPKEEKSFNFDNTLKPETIDKISDTVYIDYNYPIALSGKNRDEIFNIRKKYVSKSIFARDDYEPSDSVFGQIEDGKPWISCNICNDPETHISVIDGVSEETRFTLNPTILVSIEYPFLFNSNPNDKWCTSDINNMIPQNVKYDGAKKEITVTYKKLPFKNFDNDFYQFNGINARDLGYEYAFVDMSKSTVPIKFSNSNNISNEVIQFQNYIHVGGSCKHEGGCNNGSPRQEKLQFIQPDTDYSNDNGEIYIKLWKNYPNSSNDEPDIAEKIVIEQY